MRMRLFGGVTVRILYFAHFAGGSDAASAMDSDLFMDLRAQGHEVVVLAPFRNPEVGRVHGDIVSGSLPRAILALFGYARVVWDGLRLSEGRTLVSQYHSFHPATFAAFLVARIRDRPLVARVHDLLPGSYRSSRQGALSRAAFRMYKRILSHELTWTFVPSPELRALAVKELGLDDRRMIAMQNNVTPFPDPDPRGVAGLRTSLRLDDRRLLLQFGSFTDGGRATFVDALRILAPRNVTGLVLADPSRGAMFREEARRRGVTNLLVLPIQPRERLAEFLWLADACVGLLTADPIARGSLPRSTLETMAMGKPAILCRGLASSWLPEDACLFVPPSDPAALAETVERVVGDPAFAHALGTRAKEAVRLRFRSDVVAREFVQALGGIP